MPPHSDCRVTDPTPGVLRELFLGDGTHRGIGEDYLKDLTDNELFEGDETLLVRASLIAPTLVRERMREAGIVVDLPEPDGLAGVVASMFPGVLEMLREAGFPDAAFESTGAGEILITLTSGGYPVRAPVALLCGEGCTAEHVRGIVHVLEAYYDRLYSVDRWLPRQVIEALPRSAAPNELRELSSCLACDAPDRDDAAYLDHLVLTLAVPAMVLVRAHEDGLACARAILEDVAASVRAEADDAPMLEQLGSLRASLAPIFCTALPGILEAQRASLCPELVRDTLRELHGVRESFRASVALDESMEVCHFEDSFMRMLVSAFRAAGPRASAGVIEEISAHAIEFVRPHGIRDDAFVPESCWRMGSVLDSVGEGSQGAATVRAVFESASRLLASDYGDCGFFALTTVIGASPGNLPPERVRGIADAILEFAASTERFDDLAPYARDSFLSEALGTLGAGARSDAIGVLHPYFERLAEAVPRFDRRSLLDAVQREFLHDRGGVRSALRLETLCEYLEVIATCTPTLIERGAEIGPSGHRSMLQSWLSLMRSVSSALPPDASRVEIDGCLSSVRESVELLFRDHDEERSLQQTLGAVMSTGLSAIPAGRGNVAVVRGVLDRMRALSEAACDFEQYARSPDSDVGSARDADLGYPAHLRLLLMTIQIVAPRGGRLDAEELARVDERFEGLLAASADFQNADPRELLPRYVRRIALDTLFEIWG